MTHKRFLLLALVVLCAVALPLSYNVLALDIDPQKLTEIRQNCTSAQINLKQLQKRDAVSRINRGRAYDSMLRQVSALNSRFAYNKITAPDFVRLASDLERHVDQFRAVYSSYDEQLSQAIDIDCKQETSKFYEHIVHAREQRAALADEVAAIADLSKQFRAKLVEHQKTLPAETNEGVVQQ